MTGLLRGRRPLSFTPSLCPLNRTHTKYNNLLIFEFKKQGLNVLIQNAIDFLLCSSAVYKTTINCLFVHFEKIVCC